MELEPRLERLSGRLRSLGADPEAIFVVRVPLRVCPLGAHVDHQGGVVTGLTVDRGIVLAAAPVEQPVLRVTSLEFPGVVEVRLDHEVCPRRGDWGDYVRGAVTVLGEVGRLRCGLSAVVSGDLPGTGLSSSAAVLLAYLHALAEVNRIELEARRAAALVQAAENRYVGLASGLLDPSVMLWSRAGHLTRIDCDDLTAESVPLPPGAPPFLVLVAFSGLSRQLVATGFNDRVGECQEAARVLLERGGLRPSGTPRLRDVPRELFEAEADRIDPVLARRAIHYFGEQARVGEGTEAWRRGDLSRFGALVTASGDSSIVSYETGTPELVALYRLLIAADGVFGARFSGGGFGGSCVALVDPAAAEGVVAEVERGYAAAYPDLARTASFDLCRTSGPLETLRSAELPWTR